MLSKKQKLQIVNQTIAILDFMNQEDVGTCLVLRVLIRSAYPTELTADLDLLKPYKEVSKANTYGFGFEDIPAEQWEGSTNFEKFVIRRERLRKFAEWLESTDCE